MKLAAEAAKKLAESGVTADDGDVSRFKLLSFT